MKEFLCIVMLLYVHKLLHEKKTTKSTETNCLYINNKFDFFVVLRLIGNALDEISELFQMIQSCA